MLVTYVTYDRLLAALQRPHATSWHRLPFCLRCGAAAAPDGVGAVAMAGRGSTPRVRTRRCSLQEAMAGYARMVPDGEKRGSVTLNITGLQPNSYFGGYGTSMHHWSRLRSLSQRAARGALSLFHQRVSPISYN